MVDHTMTSNRNTPGMCVIHLCCRLFGWGGVGLLCLLLTPSQGLRAVPLPDLGRRIESALAIEQERLLGDLAISQIRGQQQLLTDPLLEHYLTRLGQRLLLQADSLRQPLRFYWLNQSSLNAFTLFGGHVVLHTSLLQATDCESELAAVMAHEISHVTQRHLARLIEAQQRTKPIAWVAALGSAMLILANPTAGLAALTSTLGGIQQHALAYTQAHEQEADRMGIILLTRAGFDPQAMASFLEKLAASARYTTHPPEILLTHPLPQRRLAEIRGRLLQPKSSKQVPLSVEYLLAKIRYQQVYATQIAGRLQGVSAPSVVASVSEQAWQPLLQGYQQALEHYRQGKFEQASQLLQPLLVVNPENLWLIDLMGDLDLVARRYTVAIQRLQQALDRHPDHPVLLLNLARAYLKQGDGAAAVSLLQPYCFSSPQSSLGWRLLTEGYGARGMYAEGQAAQAEWLALHGEFATACQALQRAHRAAGESSLKALRYQARIEQLKQYQNALEQAKKF